MLDNGKKMNWIADSSPDYIMTIDREFKILYINRTDEGMSREQLMGSPLYLFAGSEDEQARVKSVFEITVATKLSQVFETIYYRPQGTIVYFESVVKPLIEDREVVGLTVNSRNITRRKQAEIRRDFLLKLLKHDLRNKLSMISGYLDLIREEDTQESIVSYIDPAIKATGDIFNLIQRLSLHDDITGNKQHLDMDISKIIHNVADKFLFTVKEKNIELDFDVPAIDIRGISILEELFGNIIENSIKHSGGNLIRITSQDEDSALIITIEDNGKGISSEIRDTLFQPGVKGKKSSGSGLGLYLVNKISQLVDGKVSVRDSELGGARFDIRLIKSKSDL